MSKHTPGRMPEPREPNGRGYGWKVGPAWLGENSHSEETAANARRIVACWNACEGVDTEWLEQCGSDESTRMFSLPHWVKHADELRAQRDELLEALAPFAKADLRTQGVHQRFADDVLRARAAINKVKGQA